MRPLARFVLCLLALAGCSLSGNSTSTKDDSESLVTVTKMTATGTSQSVITADVSTTTSDLADVAFQNQPKSASITNPSLSFGVTLTRYRVVYTRADGGAVPAPLEAAMSLFIPPPTTDAQGVTTAGTASTTIAVVSAAAKGSSPLTDLASGTSVAASATVTFEGQDGLGRKLSTLGGIAVVFKQP